MGCLRVKAYDMGYVPTGVSQGQFDWEAFYDRESPVLYGYLVRKVGAETAEDILQECFMRLIDLADRKGAPQNARAYLFQIARNLISDLVNLPRVEFAADEKLSAFQHSNTGEAQLFQKEITEILNEAISLLDAREAEVFELRWHQGLSTEEIAIMIKTSDRHVRRILGKAGHKIEDLFRRKGWERQHVLSA